MGYFEIDPEKLFNTTFLKPRAEERLDFCWVITGLQKIFSIVFTFIAIAGFSLYLWYLNRQNSNSLLSNLYGFMALDGIFICAQEFFNLILNEFLQQDHPMMCYVNLMRTLIATFTLLTIGMISAASAIRHFNSPKYFEYSENWSNRKFGSIILALSVVATIYSLKECGGCEDDCISKERQLIILVTILCSLFMIILVTIDDVIGISKIRSGIEGLLLGNFSTPVLHFNPASEIKVCPKRLLYNDNVCNFNFWLWQELRKSLGVFMTN